MDSNGVGSISLGLSPTLGAITLRALRRYPDRVAFSWDGGQLTYGEATELIGQVQTVFANRGLERGDCVAFLSGNRAELWLSTIAAQASGMVITWLQPLASLEDQIEQLVEVEASLVVIDCPRHEARGVELADRGEIPVVGIGAMELDDLSRAAKDVGSAVGRDVAAADELTTIHYTGGTTGRAKGVARRHPSYASVVTTVLANFEFPVDPRYMAIGPISHVTGQKIIPTLWRGGTVHLLNDPDPERMLDTIKRERITFTLMVPTMIYAMLDHPALDQADLSSLELLLYGASPMSPARLEEGIERIGPVFAQLYGQTECYPISVLRKADQADHVESCGIPVTSIDLELLDDENQPVPTGEPGEICVRGAHVMDGYWKQPELTAKAMDGGWLHTDDIAWSDERGYLHIVDRKKDMIISGGFNIYPKGIEDVLTEHEGVAAAAVFGVADERWGEATTAAVVLRSGSEATVEQLVDHVKQKKGSLETPKRLDIVDELPMTGVGKVDKQALRAQFEAN